MKNKLIILILILSSVISLAGCGSSVKYKETGMYMRNLFEIEVSAEKSYTDSVNKLMSQSVEMLKELDSSLNDLSPISEISAVNNNAAKKSISVSAELYNLIKKSVKAHQLTSGYFDIAWQPLIELFSKTKYPNYKNISEAKALSSSDLIELDKNFNKVQFKTPGVKINLELVKIGFAVDQIANILDRDYIQSLKISSGSTYYIGKKITPLELVLSSQKKLNLKLYDQGVATIFDDNQNLENYQAWSKYLDIRATTENIRSVTVVAPNAFTAEALSVAFLLMGTQKSMDLLDKINQASGKNKYYAIFLLESLEDEILVDSRKK